jgi:hypothetical protein
MGDVVEPRRLRKLLEILAEHGVTKYKDGTLEVEIDGSSMIYASQDAAKKEFDMDNYVTASGNGYASDEPISPQASDEDSMFPGYHVRSHNS